MPLLYARSRLYPLKEGRDRYVRPSGHASSGSANLPGRVSYHSARHTDPGQVGVALGRAETLWFVVVAPYGAVSRRNTVM